MSIKKIFTAALVVILMVSLMTACKAADQAGESEADILQVVNIGTQQIPNGEKIAIAKKYFEEEMGVKVNVVEFQAGDIRNALISGAIDFAMLGSTSATLGIANGMDAEVIWIHEVLGDAERLVAKNGSGIEAIQDLKGKKIATPFATTAHYSLLKALELNGISERELTLLDMQMPDIYAAWQRGDIDAAYGWEPILSDLLKDGKTIITSKDLALDGIITSNVEIVSRDFAQKYPDMVTKYIRALDRSVKLYNEDINDAVNTIAQSMNITYEDALKQTKGSLWLTAQDQLSPDYFGTSAEKGKLTDNLKDTADFLYQQKSLMSKPESETFVNAVNPLYIENAVK
ncbi:taurine ABC transporter substrate-binding protein [Proteocatella sphenisci]|uniref:taurine ABC transporter substrate-binding protein n=1 Tax=Proteocatella sphenisci TaxID=181070 RepID=UPI00048AAEA2|nr:glycine betaine ABC transporter substrate-binding protein [Proteocatella sphenisci]